MTILEAGRTSRDLRMMSVDFSVVIPTCRRLKELPEALLHESLMASKRHVILASHFFAKQLTYCAPQI